MNQPLLTQELLSQLQGAPIQKLSGQLGLAPDQAGKAVAAALPLLMGALGRNSAQPQGAQALLGALQRDHAAGGGGGFDLGGLLGAVLGGGGASRQTDGTAILGHILGGGQPRAAQALGQSTGLDSGQAMKLMAMLAPMSTGPRVRIIQYMANAWAKGRLRVDRQM